MKALKLKPLLANDNSGSNASMVPSYLFKLVFPISKSSKVLLDFEEGIENNLKSLSSSLPQASLLTWPCLRSLLSILSDKHSEALGLFGIDSNPSKSDEKLIREYLDDSAKILELCNALTPAISHLQCSLLYLRYALSSLESTISSIATATSSGDFLKAKEALDSYRSSILSGSSKARNVGTLLKELAYNNSLKFNKLKKKKISCKPLMHAWYDIHSLVLLTFASLSLALMPQEKGSNITTATITTESPRSVFPRLDSTIHDHLRLAKEERESKTSVLGLSEFATLNDSVEELLNSLNNAHPNRLIELTRDVKQQLGSISSNLDDVGKKISDYFHLIIHSRSLLVEALGNFGNSQKT